MTEVLGEKYELVRLLGEGGMGSVWEARNRITGKRVAVKRMSAALTGNHEAVERFLREARAATRIEHPNVVQIFDVGVHDGAPFMVMEYLDGEALSALRARLGVIDAPTLAELMMPVLHALAVTHSQGIVHRDLKPDNIYLVRRGARLVPKVLDFGISKTLGDTELRLTSTGAIMGTPYYMAPEQCAGRKDLDHRADIYSLGVILYEALAGRVPFDADSYNALIVAVVTSDAPPLASLRGDVPPRVVAVVERAMHRDLGIRFENVAELGRALEEAVGRAGMWESQSDSAAAPLPPGAFAATMPAGAMASFPPHAPTPTLPARTTLGGAAGEQVVEQRAPQSRGLRIVGGTIAVVALAAGALGIALAWGHQPGRPTTLVQPAQPEEPVAAAPARASAGGDASRTARALACEAEGQDRCVVEVLLGHEQTETDTRLLVDALRRLGDRAAALPLAQSYVSRWPSGVRAIEYATWLGGVAHGIDVPPHGEPLAAQPTRVVRAGRWTRSNTAHTAEADRENRAAEGVAPPATPPAETRVTPEPATRPANTRSGGLDPGDF